MIKISVKSLQQRMQEYIQELSWEPAFQRGIEQKKYALDTKINPL